MFAISPKAKKQILNLDKDCRVGCERVPSVLKGKYGKTKFHKDGKNPGDVWGDIKQLTYKSKEKEKNQKHKNCL